MDGDGLFLGNSQSTKRDKLVDYDEEILKL